MSRVVATKGSARRLPAKRVLEGAIGIVGKDVVVIGKDRAGERYLASSMPCNSVADFDATIALIEDALKAFRRYRTNQQRVEKAHVQQQG